MSIADMIPTLDDTALVNLRTNASRIEASAPGPRQKEAAFLLPLIDAELATRKANGVKMIARQVAKAGAKNAAPKKAAAPKTTRRKAAAAADEE